MRVQRFRIGTCPKEVRSGVESGKHLHSLGKASYRRRIRNGEAVESPELIIHYEPDGAPMLAVCSLCGEQMPEESPGFTHTEDAVTAFAGEFKAHLKKEHSSLPSS